MLISNVIRAETGPSTVAGTSGKGKARVAHTPTSAAATKPTVVADPNSKVRKKKYVHSCKATSTEYYVATQMKPGKRAVI